MSAAAAIKVAGLSKAYGTHTAVDDVSFVVRQGSVTGSFGPNGAGKSTTLRMLVGCWTRRPSTRAAPAGRSSH